MPAVCSTGQLYSTCLSGSFNEEDWLVELFLQVPVWEVRTIFSLRLCAHSLFLGFVFPFLINALLERMGYRWTLRTIALLQGVLGGIAVLGVKPRIPVLKYRSGQRRPHLIPPRIQFMKRHLFWAYVSIHPIHFVIPV